VAGRIARDSFAEGGGGGARAVARHGLICAVRTATLYLNATPTWATIVLDGKPVGTTPMILNEVPAGRHTVDAQPLGKGPSMHRELVLEAGHTARVGFDLGPGGVVASAENPSRAPASSHSAT
jgi:hypothetical protein